MANELLPVIWVGKNIGLVINICGATSRYKLFPVSRVG
jgi:hypothetical protein